MQFHYKIFVINYFNDSLLFQRNYPVIKLYDQSMYKHEKELKNTV